MNWTGEQNFSLAINNERPSIVCHLLSFNAKTFPYFPKHQQQHQSHPLLHFSEFYLPLLYPLREAQYIYVCIYNKYAASVNIFSLLGLMRELLWPKNEKQIKRSKPRGRNFVRVTIEVGDQNIYSDLWG